MQREAVLATEGPLLILAGAGSGKTTVLINRVANLLKYGRASDTDEVPENATEAELAVLEAGPSPEAEELAAYEPVEPWRIIAITFTNKAADELKARLAAKLGPKADDIWGPHLPQRLRAHTAPRRGQARLPARFHHLRHVGPQQRDEGHTARHGFGREDIPAAQHPRHDRRREGPAHVAGALRRPPTGRARTRGRGRYARYTRPTPRGSFKAGAMDFEDLIYNTVLLFKEHPDVLEHYQRQFKYVLIDEYQDTNHLQYLLASQLAGGWGNICVVGDDDQSIYKFRGATIENITQLREAV